MYQHSVWVVMLRDTAGQLIEWPRVSAGPAHVAALAGSGSSPRADRPGTSRVDAV